MHKYSHINLTNIEDFVFKISAQELIANNMMMFPLTKMRTEEKLSAILKSVDDSNKNENVAFINVRKLGISLYMSSGTELFKAAENFIEEKLSEKDFYAFVSKVMFLYIQEKGSLIDFHKEVVETLKEKKYCDGFNSKRLEILNLLTTEVSV